MITRPIEAKVFLEGIQIPFFSLSLAVGPNRTNVLTLAVAPAARLFEIIPRTIVQVYVDYGEGFKTFFEGEVVAHGFSKDATSGRSMVLTCLDFANVWQYSYAFFLHGANVNTLSTHDAINQFSEQDPLRSADKKLQERVFAVRGIGEPATALLKSKDIITGIKQVFSLIRNVNGFYSDQFTKFKLEERLFNLPDDQIQFFLNPQASEFGSFHLNNHPSLTPALQVLSVMLQSLFHNFWSMPLPTVNPDTGNPNNFILIPSSFLTAPPNCNVIFPDLHEGFSYSRPFLAEPTRFELYTGGNEENDVVQFYRSPPEFVDLHSKLKADQGSNKGTKEENLLVESDNPELDEQSIGLLPQRESLQQSAYASVRKKFIEKFKDEEKSKAAARGEIHKQLTSIADFEFLLRKFRNRTFDVTMPFNPNIHPAFPILLIDKEGSIFASPLGLTHTIDAKGSAKTTLECRYARNKDVLGDVISEPPLWINRSFIPDAIGEDSFDFTDADGEEKTVEGAYPKILGTGSVLSRQYPVRETNSLKKPETQEEAAQLLLDLYLNVGDREAFITEFTRREIMTLEENLKFLGIEEINEEELQGNLYDTAKRAVIQDVKIQLVEAGFAIAET